MPESALPPGLKRKKHTDYPPGLRWVPRGWTAWRWGEPIQIVGSWFGGEHPKPITEPGTWQLSFFPRAAWWSLWGLYFEFTTAGGLHFRIGARWDDVDDYVEWPSVAIKRGVK